MDSIVRFTSQCYVGTRDRKLIELRHIWFAPQPAPLGSQPLQHNTSAKSYAMAELTWGPEFSRYSIRDFEPRASDRESREAQVTHESFNAHSLARLEHALGKLEIRTLDINCVNTDSIEGSSMTISISVYSASNGKCKLFKYYYGFLCIRYLVHDTCFAVLGISGAWNRVLATVPSDATWTQSSHIVAFRALDVVAEMTRSPGFFESFCQKLLATKFGGDETSRKILAQLIIMMLWRDRDSFLTLCSRGMLPGCALFLLVAFRLLPVDSSDEAASACVICLRDLMYRVYLVGSHRDREFLQVICIPVLRRPVLGGDGHNYHVTPEDGQAIRQAFFGLLTIWKQARFNVGSIPMEVLSRVSGFVLLVSFVNTASVTTQEQIDVTRTALQLWWLIVENKVPFPAADVPEFRVCAHQILVHIE
ncbi:MYND Zn-finger protein [Ceratobasidium sp. AG-Ba]|nr:MYND Zn-finger protein [Ceratobasidium sp. AG-Ba]